MCKNSTNQLDISDQIEYEIDTKTDYIWGHELKK